MKKFTFLLIGSFLLSNLSYGQAVDDRAVIPVAVTLSSILRLNVVSGGNVEFTFNTLADYQNGIENSPSYDTKFTVASSVHWDVVMYSEEADLVSTDEVGGSTMPLDNIGYSVSSEGWPDLADLNFESNDITAPAALTAGEVVIVGYDATPNAGDITGNDFTIHWQCGTQIGDMNGSSILNQQLAADRYATNVFLILRPAE